MKKRIFICFTGIDGSGKTTLAKTLVDTVKRNGIECRYVYSRFNPFLLKPFLIFGRVLFLRGKDMFGDYTKDSNAKKKLFKNRFLSIIYQSCLLFDYSFQIFSKVKIPLMFGKNIICDRYIYDTVCTDLAVDLNYSDWKAKDILTKCLYLFPKPDMIFLIDVPEGIAYSRKGDVPSIRYLRDRKKYYLSIVNMCNMIKIEGEQKIEDVERKIFSKVLSKLDEIE